MATDAVLVDRALQQLARVRTSVRVVTTGAGNLARDRACAKSAELCSPHSVALQAQFRLRFPGAYVFGEGRAVARVCSSQSCIPFSGASVVNLMAVHAGHGPRLVRAAPPEHLIPLGVEERQAALRSSTGVVESFVKRTGIVSLPPPASTWALPGPWQPSQPSFSSGVLGVGHGIAHDGVNETLLLVGMAGHADLSADVVASGWASGCVADEASAATGLLLSWRHFARQSSSRRLRAQEQQKRSGLPHRSSFLLRRYTVNREKLALCPRALHHCNFPTDR